MIPVRAGILLGFLCSALSVRSQAQKVDSIPEVSHQEGLSRTTIIMNFGGPAVSGMGFEYSYFRTPKLSLDIRTVGLIIPDKFNPGYVLYAGPQLQLGAKTSRFILGLGYIASDRYYRGIGESSRRDNRGFFDYNQGVALTLGYRAQHKHGFFIELDAHLIYSTQGGFGASLENQWGLTPWPGLVFGYRIPSREMRDKWNAESRKYKPLVHKERNAKREGKIESREDRQLERQFNRSDKKERRIRRDERIKAEFRPVRMDSTSRNYGHVFGEAYGLATWTINYTYSHPFKKVENFGLVARVGAGYTEMLSVPVGIGIQFLKMNNSVSLNTGIVLTSKAKTTVFYYTGFTGHINIYKGLTMGLGGYLLINPHGSHIEFNRRSDISIMMGGSLGYRLGR